MPGNELVQSVLRAVEILNLAARSHDGMTLAELSKLLRLKSSTVHNLARTLAAAGYLQKTEAPVRYHLGPALLEVAATYRDYSLKQRSRPVLQSLCLQDGAILASLAEYRSSEIVQVLRIDENAAGVVQEPRPRPLHPYGSGSALVFQAFWSTQEREHYRNKHSFALFGSHFWSSLDHLESYLHQVRMDGYAVTPVRDERIERISAPVFDSTGRIEAVLTAGFVETDGKNAGCMTKVKEKARTLSGRHLDVNVE